ncbi:hypothetical protein ACFVFQ_32950 [Streptomyces sp. NPDC057743]
MSTGLDHIQLAAGLGRQEKAAGSRPARIRAARHDPIPPTPDDEGCSP